MRRALVAVGCPVVGVLLVGCASLPGSRTGARAFDPALQEQLIRQRQERASAEAPPAAAGPSGVEDRLRRGDGLRRDGAAAAAMWSYLQAHELDPSAPEPIARMASLHLQVDPERAEALFHELLEEHPEGGAAHTGLGLVRIERHDWAGAREALETALRSSPRSAVAHSALGVCLDRLGEPAEARRAYLRAIELAPRFYEALNNLGVSYLTTGEFDAAAEVLRRAARQQARDPAVHNNLGLALGRLRRYDDALAAFRRAGEEQAARNNLGYVSYLNGDYQRAIAEYERALLASGGQRLQVLRNLRVAKRAQRESDPSAEGTRR